MPEAAAATIFEPFNTGKAGREGAGAGLGLAICRQIAERMGGDIALGASPQGGARFQVRLPLRPAIQGQTAAPDMVAPPRTRRCMCWWWTTTPPTVSSPEAFGDVRLHRRNGRERARGRRRRLARPFDLVLMDIKMPVMDGVAATRAIRALPAPMGALPILALTANADERDEMDYVAAGMNGVAQSRSQPDALLNAIRLVMTAAAEAALSQAA